MEIVNTADIDIKENVIASVYLISNLTAFRNRPILIKLITLRWKQPIFDKVVNFVKLNLAMANDASTAARKAKSHFNRQDTYSKSKTRRINSTDLR